MSSSFRYMYLLLSCLLISYALISQDAKKVDTTKSTDSAIATLSSDVAEILQRIKKGENADKEPTGILKFDTSKKYSIYTRNGLKTARVAAVDKVTFLIQDGYILDINVFAGDRTFTNTSAPITVSGMRFSMRYLDFLQNVRNPEEHVLLQQCISYESLNTFFPEDGLVVLTRKTPFDTLFKNVGVNTVLDLRLYTDALATLGDEPNGIFLTDLRLKQFLHRRHYQNSGKKTFNFLKFNLTGTKLDSKYSAVDSSSNVSRSALIQRNKFNAELLINIYNNWLGKKTLNNYYFDFGGGFSNVNLARAKDTITIKVQTLILEAGLNLKNSSNIGFDFHTRYMIQYSPSTDFKDQHVPVHFLKMGGEVYWNPFKDVASRIFARINYTMGLKKEEKKNSFSQVQIGYSTLLSKAIGKK